METRANYIIIGAFMMATLIGAFAFVYWLAATAESRENVLLKIIFPAPVTGLPVGGQVQFNGIRIGDVKSLDFDPTNPKVVVATVRVRPTAPLRTDTSATLNFTGLTGVAYVDLNGGSLDAPLLLDPDSNTIPVLEAHRSLFDDIVGGARDVLEKADTTMGTIDTLLRQNEDSISQTIKNVEIFSGALAKNSDGVADFMASLAQVSEAITKLSGRMETLVSEGERLLAAVPSEKVTSIVEDIETFSRSLGEAGEGIDLLVADARTTAGALSTFAEGLNASLSQVEQVIAAVDPQDIRRTVKGAAALGEVLDNRASNIDAIIVASNETLENISEVSGTIRAHQSDIGAALAGSRSMIDNANKVADQAVKIAEAVDPEKVARAVSSAETFADNLNQSLARVDAVVAGVDPAKVEALVSDAAGFMENIRNQETQINEIIVSTKSAVQNFEAVSAYVRDQDERILSLVENVRTAADQFTQTLSSANAVLKAVDPQQVAQIVGSVETVTGGLAGQKQTIDQMIASAGGAARNVEQMTADLKNRTPDVNEIISDAKQMVATLNATSLRVQGIVDQVGSMVEGDSEGLIVEATKAAASIRKVASAFESRADSIAGGLSKFANQGTADFAAAMAQINRTLVSIQRAVENFDRSPNRIIFGGEDVPTYSGGRRR